MWSMATSGTNMSTHTGTALLLFTEVTPFSPLSPSPFSCA